ncbi:A disintegrin and metalloproteinase with thrombospondin motifs 1 [Ooceraea biroi]|nr:A disintegrin and metalloproteinase with thrombospondin motifs 1 [Ooceraea biroi]XP_026831025.1 A disintegrin and metalloproteinase with thrombospondin motifs 1 [Ooceraea biroi]
MTPDEVMSVFHAPHHLVPEYEVVPVLHRTKKQEDSDVSEVKVKAFNDEVKLYLNPTEGILASKNTPVWTVKSNPEASEGLQYEQVLGAMKSLGVALQDVDSSSAVVVTPTPNGKIHLDGIIKDAYVIKSLPQRILQKVLYGGKKLFEPLHTKNVTSDDEYAYTHHHVVYKVPPNPLKDFKITDPDKKVNAPNIIYPELLVVVDYKEYKLLGGNVEQAVKYIFSFWNGVDLRYRLLTTPKIRFNIVGVVIATDPDATPYLEKNRHEDSENAVDADRALRGMADYFYRETRFPTDYYDIAISMTRLDLCNMLTEDYCDLSTLGYAYVAGACDRNATKQSSEAVGIIEDNGGFGGIITAAHEIGHLIGARHDGNPNGAGDCPAHEGFIMTGGLMLHENGFEWSTCSIDAFYKFINEDRAKCLYNEPLYGDQLPRVLPGKLLSLNEQCKMTSGTPACNKDATVCTRLECEYPGFEGYCTAAAPAAEGSPCGDGLYCLNGKCVLEGIITKEQEKKKSLKDYLPRLNIQEIKKITWMDLVRKVREMRDKVKEKVKEKLKNIFGPKKT